MVVALWFLVLHALHSAFFDVFGLVFGSWLQLFFEKCLRPNFFRFGGGLSEPQIGRAKRKSKIH